jgi:hypothetical protein
MYSAVECADRVDDCIQCEAGKYQEGSGKGFCKSCTAVEPSAPPKRARVPRALASAALWGGTPVRKPLHASVATRVIIKISQARATAKCARLVRSLAALPKA